MPDKYTAIWVSHSSISDFLNCPRSYYLKNVYKDSNTGHKITLMSPALALGQTVHSVLEGLSKLPRDERFSKSLIAIFDEEWEKISGRKGGFSSDEQEYQYKKRGQEMLRRVYNNPGPIEKKAIKIQEELPAYWLSEEDNIRLCGKIDWLEYIEEKDSVHIIDFKTGKKKENDNSLQLPIYHLLVHNCQKRKVEKASYWYLETDDKPSEVVLPDLGEAHRKVLDIAKKIKLARQIEKYDCPKGGNCFFCDPMEKILKGGGEFIGTDNYKRDIYILKNTQKDNNESSEDNSVIL